MAFAALFSWSRISGLVELLTESSLTASSSISPRLGADSTSSSVFCLCISCCTSVSFISSLIRWTTDRGTAPLGPAGAKLFCSADPARDCIFSLVCGHKSAAAIRTTDKNRKTIPISFPSFLCAHWLILNHLNAYRQIVEMSLALHGRRQSYNKLGADP